MTKAIRTLRAFLIATTFLSMLAAFATARADELTGGGPRNSSVSLPLAFSTYLDANLPEQDVYIERIPGSGEVFRVTKADVDPNTELFAAAYPVPHDPMNPAAIGPYPKGGSLGFTLGAWRAHRGAGVYACENGTATIDTTFSGLVPNGVYSIRHTFSAMPDRGGSAGSLNLPLAPQKSAEHTFVADETGRASFHDSFSPCLQFSNARITAMLAINYHSDGRTYRGKPGEHGLNAHMPLFLVLPQQEEI